MKGQLKTVVGILLSLLLLGWALRDVSAAEVVHELRQADLLLLSLAVLVSLIGFAFRAIRWGILLQPLAPDVPFGPRFASTVIGFAANNLLPARVGEFARALALGRLTTVPVAAAFATLVIERLLDGLVLVGLLFAAMATASFPATGAVGGVDPRQAATVVAVVMLVAGGVLFLLVIAPGGSVRLAERVSRRLFPAALHRPLIAALHSFVAGLVVLRSGRLFLVSLGWAAAQWLFLALSFLLAFRAFDISQVPFAGAVFLQSLISLAVAVPSSPGFFGPFEAAAVLGLGLWGVSSGKAVSFAVGFHLGGFLPTTLLGIYYVWRLKLSWREVKHSEQAVERDTETRGADGAVVENGA